MSGVNYFVCPRCLIKKCYDLELVWWRAAPAGFGFLRVFAGEGDLDTDDEAVFDLVGDGLNGGLELDLNDFASVFADGFEIGDTTMWTAASL